MCEAHQTEHGLVELLVLADVDRVEIVGVVVLTVVDRVRSQTRLDQTFHTLRRLTTFEVRDLLAQGIDQHIEVEEQVATRSGDRSL
ncbi:hypothetical protein D3C75_1248360 [compost metagenome]